MLLIQDFFPSQKYYFHEEYQLEMVAKFCPFIKNIFFVFHEACVTGLLTILFWFYVLSCSRRLNPFLIIES